MARKKSNDGWWIGLLLGAVGVGLIYYAQTGLGKENDSALLPNTLEDRIDALVAALNTKLGKRWLDFGVNVIMYYIQSALPAYLVTLVNIVVAVERMSRVSWMTSYEKRQLAVQMASAR